MDGKWEYKKITLDKMMDFIAEKHPEHKVASGAEKLQPW